MWGSTRHLAGMWLGQDRVCPLQRRHSPCPLWQAAVPQPSPYLGRRPRPRPLSADCSVATGLWLPPGHEPWREHQGQRLNPCWVQAGGLHFQGRQAPGNSLLRVIPPKFTGLHNRAVWAETLREMSNKAQAALPAGKWESDLTAAGVRRNLGDGSNGRFHPPSAAGLGNVQLSVGFVGVVLLPLFTSSTPWKSCWEPKHLKAA